MVDLTNRAGLIGVQYLKFPLLSHEGEAAVALNVSRAGSGSIILSSYHFPQQDLNITLTFSGLKRFQSDIVYASERYRYGSVS